MRSVRGCPVTYQPLVRALIQSSATESGPCFHAAEIVAGPFLTGR